MTTGTPRTDAVDYAPVRFWKVHAYELACSSRQLERELNASKAEVTEIRNALGDDGRRTHKEFLVLATKASVWKLWKEKYIHLRNAHMAEGQDPAGTIWEHADKLQKDLKETKAEVESLRKELDNWDYGTRAKREQERAEKAEVEIAKLNHQLLNTENDLLQSQAEVDRLTGILKSLRKSPSIGWHRSHKVLLK